MVRLPRPLRPFCPLGLLLIAALPAFAAPAPPSGPAPDALESTLAIVDDLLTRFEETAASHHVLLVKAPAARREAALQLVRLGRKAEAQGDAAMARRCLGWAAAFPGTWWYQGTLDAGSLQVLLEAAAQVERECEERQGCLPLPVQGDGAAWQKYTALAERRPYMPPPQISAAPTGEAMALLDFTHYPRGGFAVQVSAPGVPELSGSIADASPILQVPAALGAYSITAQLPAGPVTHRYRAAVVSCSADGLRLNGKPWQIRARRLLHAERATPESARAAIAAAMSEGCNLGIATAPPPWLLDLAEELQFALAVEPEVPGPDAACMLCAGGTGVAGLQDRIAAHIQRYAEAPAVQIWLALAPLEGDATAALHAVYPMYKQLDVYERPVAYLGGGDSTMLDIALAEGTAEEREVQAARAKKLDMPFFISGSTHPGAAGIVAGEIDLAEPAP